MGIPIVSSAPFGLSCFIVVILDESECQVDQVANCAKVRKPNIDLSAVIVVTAQGPLRADSLRPIVSIGVFAAVLSTGTCVNYQSKYLGDSMNFGQAFTSLSII